ncbi:hypothetical protein O181_111868 [Austropuccinia psidii MF-1]|uniref:Uncharacterized protein n=1 Tax=Austropuccinia psidii MF-1 TaxID=1389203 RepID=A0A9Q3JZD3_9BASI|nr:hypothetical protein [Austropuccinia psidii MF-1]
MPKEVMSWMVNQSIGHLQSSYPPQPPVKEFHSKVIISTPTNFQPVLSTIPYSIPPPSPNPPTSRTSLAFPNRSPIPYSRPSPMPSSKQLKPVESTSRRREDIVTLAFLATQVFQRRESWPVRVTREDPNISNEAQYSVFTIFHRVEENSREVMVYATDRMDPCNASEDMTAKFVWY